MGTLFLQLTVDDMGICMPLNTAPTSLWMNSGRPEGNNRQGHSSEPEICSAVVVTLENSSISACSSGSLVSKGKFTGLCFRFADDFETGLDDWKPDMDDPAIMNLCVVFEATYEVCRRTCDSTAAAAAAPTRRNRQTDPARTSAGKWKEWTRTFIRLLAGSSLRSATP